MVLSNKKLVDRFKNIPTPFYYYDIDLLKATLDLVFRESSRYGYLVHFAIKANANDKILKIIRDYGFGADCVSGNEIKKSSEIGFPPDKIVYAGVGKSDTEINVALDHDIFCFNCESIQEIEVLDDLAKRKNKTARIALRINPNVNPNTHKYITTGLEDNKFGINPWDIDMILEKLKTLNNLDLCGVHYHIGSQITNLNVFRDLCLKANEINKVFNTQKIQIDHINVGGGFGIDYGNPDENNIPDFVSYFKTFNDHIELQPHQKLHFELGRSIIAQCGSIVSRVLFIKKGINKQFAIVDAGMTELIRSALYSATHNVINISSTKPEEKYDVVGPICESADFFARDIMLPKCERNDFIMIQSAGAYGQVMSSQYNLRDLAKAYYSDEFE